MAHKNVSVVNGGVFDPEAIADMTSNLTRLERALSKVTCHAYNDHRLWRRIAIPTKPMRVHPTDCPRALRTSKDLQEASAARGYFTEAPTMGTIAPR